MLPYTPPIPIESQTGSAVTGGAPPSVLQAASNALIPPGPGAIANPHNAIPALPDAGYTAPSGSVYSYPTGPRNGTPFLDLFRERELAGGSVYAGGSMYGGPSAHLTPGGGTVYGAAPRGPAPSIGTGPSMAGWAESVTHHLAPTGNAGHAGEYSWTPTSLPAPRQGAVPLAGSPEYTEYRHRRHLEYEDGAHHRDHHHHHHRHHAHGEREREHEREPGATDVEHDKESTVSDGSFYAKPKGHHPYRGNGNGSERSPSRSPSEHSSPSAAGNAEVHATARRGSMSTGRPQSLSPAPTDRHGVHSSHGQHYSPTAPSPLSLRRDALTMPPPPMHHRRSPGVQAPSRTEHGHKRHLSASASGTARQRPASDENLRRSFRLMHLAPDEDHSYYAPSSRGTVSSDGSTRPPTRSRSILHAPLIQRAPPADARTQAQAQQQAVLVQAGQDGFVGVGRPRARSLADYGRPMLPPGYAQSAPGMQGLEGAVPPSVVGQGYDEDGSLAGSNLTYFDGPVGEMTSQYGLPKYGHHPKPDHRRFMLQRGKADVFMG